MSTFTNYLKCIVFLFWFPLSNHQKYQKAEIQQSNIVSHFVSLLVFISLTKIVLAFSKQIVMSSCVSFQMPMCGWMKWNSKSNLVQDLEAMMCTGLLDGKSALEIQMEHPAYQIFNLTNFPSNVSHLQLKMGLESAATVTFSSPQVVPSHSPPPSFLKEHPCLESQAMKPLHDPHSLSTPMVTVRSKQPFSSKWSSQA